MFITPTLNISCITCVPGDHDEAGSNKKESEGKKNMYSSVVAPELYGGMTGGRLRDDGIYDGIREITLVYGDQCIDSICAVYDKDGSPVIGERHGGGVRGRDLQNQKPLDTVQVKLEYPNEFMVSVSGHFSRWKDTQVVRSLTFESNTRTYGPFGLQDGTPFSFKVKDGDQIVGLRGRGGWYLYAIGFHSKLPELYGGKSLGRLQDDGICDGIREITLVYGDQCIDSICAVYDKDGLPVIGERHGGSVRGRDLQNQKPLDTVQVKLEYPNEFMVGVSGHFSRWKDTHVVRSLKFESNRRTYGPFGLQVGTPFSFRVKDGDQIVRLRGRGGWYLYAIGFHTSPAPSPAPERGLFQRVRKGFWNAYESLVENTKPLTSVDCTCLSL